MTPSDKVMEDIVWACIPQAANYLVPEESDGYNEGEVYNSCIQVYKSALLLNEGYIQYLIDKGQLQVMTPKTGTEWEEYIRSLNK